mmetsp:Transcript_6800/g.17848  ORF Transcript_6800/g.17848 Transcript_6800/m.17848 type:complete len:463 (-) Transcript_6800:253-1641(-)
MLLALALASSAADLTDERLAEGAADARRVRPYILDELRLRILNGTSDADRSLPHRSINERFAWGQGHAGWYRSLGPLYSDNATGADAGPVVVVPLCNQGRDYTSMPAEHEIDRALLKACAHKASGSRAPLWAITYGFDRTAHARLRAAGYKIADFTHLRAAQFTLAPLTGAERAQMQALRDRIARNASRGLPIAASARAQLRKMPQTWGTGHKEVQARRDYVCTSVKLFAWNLSAHSNVLLTDADLLLRDDPLPWMESHRHEVFVGMAEGASRSYRGLNSRLAYLQPDTRLFELLRRAALSGNFVPYTSSEQDVLESFFSAPFTHRAGGTPLPMPDSVHDKEPWCEQQGDGHLTMVCHRQVTYGVSRRPCDDVRKWDTQTPLPLAVPLLARGATSNQPSAVGPACCPRAYLKSAKTREKCGPLRRDADAIGALDQYDMDGVPCLVAPGGDDAEWIQSTVADA